MSGILDASRARTFFETAFSNLISTKSGCDVPKSMFVVTISFASLLLLTQWTSAQQDSSHNENQKSKCKLDLVVTDDSGTPLNGAEIEVLKWTGKLESIGVNGSTSGDGNLVLDVPFSDSYYYLKFACKGYATSQRDLQLTPDEQKTINFKLSRPVQSWIKLTAGGKPLAGAEFSFFEITSCSIPKAESFTTIKLALVQTPWALTRCEKTNSR